LETFDNFCKYLNKTILYIIYDYDHLPTATTAGPDGCAPWLYTGVVTFLLRQLNQTGITAFSSIGSSATSERMLIGVFKSDTNSWKTIYIYFCNILN
jgi:hypothetical protein